VIDTSGSMASKIDSTISGMKKIFDILTDMSRISCIVFNNSSITKLGLKKKKSWLG